MLPLKFVVFGAHNLLECNMCAEFTDESDERDEMF